MTKDLDIIARVAAFVLIILLNLAFLPPLVF
jgi:hypothetical protein